MLWTLPFLLTQIIPQANACGGFFGPAKANVFSDAQQVLFETEDGRIVVEYLVDYDGEASAFGWVIPIPGTLSESDIAEGDAERMDDLQNMTEPWTRFESASSGCSMPFAAGGKADSLGANREDTGGLSGGVNVVGDGTVGPYDFAILEATSTTALLEWLDDNDFELGGSEAALNAYVSEGDFQFVAVHLNETWEQEEETDTGWWVEPSKASIRLTYDGTQMRYPAVLSSASSAETQRTSVYVIGPEKATVNGWTAETVRKIIGSESDDYSDLYAAKLWELGGAKRGYALVYADAHGDGTWLTRFDTYANSSAHVEDPIFALNGGASGEVIHTEIVLYESNRDRNRAEGRAGLALMLLPLGLGWRRRRG